MVHALVVAVALVALACLPCVVAILITSADEYAERVGRAMNRGLRRCRHSLASHPSLRWLEPPAPPTPIGPPIEQIAADLRRLGRQRLDVGTRSPMWHNAVQRAYDDRLCLACRSLGVEQHFAELDGVDLDIERLRVEGELTAAGMVLSVDADGRMGNR